MSSRTIQEKRHHFIEPHAIQFTGNDKTDKAIIRLERRRLKIEKEERWLSFARDVAERSSSGFWEAVSTIGSGVANAHGEMFRGWFSNTDPLTWSGDAVAVGIYVTTVVGMVRAFGKIIGIDDLPAIIGLNGLQNLPQSVSDTVSTLTSTGNNNTPAGPIAAAVGRDDHSGVYGFAPIDSNGVIHLDKARWYTNASSRDLAWGILQAPGAVLADGGVAYKKISRTNVGGNNFAVMYSDIPQSLSSLQGFESTLDPHTFSGHQVVLAHRKPPYNDWIIVNTDYGGLDVLMQSFAVASNNPINDQVVLVTL